MATDVIIDTDALSWLCAAISPSVRGIIPAAKDLMQVEYMSRFHADYLAGSSPAFTLWLNAITVAEIMCLGKNDVDRSKIWSIAGNFSKLTYPLDERAAVASAYTYSGFAAANGIKRKSGDGRLIVADCHILSITATRRMPMLLTGNSRDFSRLLPFLPPGVVAPQIISVPHHPLKTNPQQSLLTP